MTEQYLTFKAKQGDWAQMKGKKKGSTLIL